MEYFESVYDEKNHITYSCDMVRYTIEIRKDCAEAFSQRFSADSRIDVVVYPVSFRPMQYKQLITVNVGTSSVSMGIGFNGFSADDNLRGFIEFNPNKVFPDWRKEFIDICGWCTSVNVSRLDVAIDIPYYRNDVVLLKDGRLYEYQQHAVDDATEYLGRRNSVGRVKVYNKQKEQKLSYPLTRVEITTEADIEAFKKHIPQVVISETGKQLNFSHIEASELSQNDRVTVALLNSMDIATRMQWVQKYSYRFRQKISKYIMTDNRLDVNLGCVRKVIDSVNMYSRLTM